MRRRKVLIGAGLALAIALVVAGNLARRTQGGPAVSVKVLKVVPATLAATVEAQGEVEPVERVEVRAPASGTLAAVKVEEGDRVEKGQVLAAYDREDLAQALNQARSQAAAARAQVAQLESKLSLERDLRAEEVAQAEARLSEAEAGGDPVEVAGARAALEAARRAQAGAGKGQALEEQLAAARAALVVAEEAARRAEAESAAAEVTAPVAGVVLSREGTRMGPVARGAILFVLSDTGRLVVRAKVDEVDIGGVRLGDAATVTHSAFPGREFKGRVARIAPQARRDPNPGQSNVVTFDVRIEVENPEGLLRPGMSVDVKIVSKQKEDALALPAEAVVERGGKRGVFVLEGGVVRFRPVTTGLATQTEVEVTEGLKAGEPVVVGNLDVLKKLEDGRRALEE